MVSKNNDGNNDFDDEYDEYKKFNVQFNNIDKRVLRRKSKNKRIYEMLKKYNIKPDSEEGFLLILIDKYYQEEEEVVKEITRLKLYLEFVRYRKRYWIDYVWNNYD